MALQFIEHGGVRSAVDVTGNGPPLLMLHGAEGSRRQFAAVTPLLADRFTVIAYDQRDCGETVNPEAPTTLSALADDAKDLLAALGHPTAFVFGASFGGRIAQALAVRHPPVVARLVLASTWPLPVSLAEANAEVAHELFRLRADLPASAEALAEYFFPAAFLAAQPAFRGHFKSAPARSARSERRGAVVGDRPDLDLSRIERPTLVIAGAVDRVVPAAITLSLVDRIRGATSVVLPEVGHLTLAQAPDVVARHVRAFLA